MWSKMREKFLIILSILIAVLIIGGIYYFLTNDKSLENAEEVTYINLGVIPEISTSSAKFLNNNIYINEGGTYNISGVLINGTIFIDTTEEVNIIFNKVTIVNEYGSILDNRKSKLVRIVLEKETNNILSDGINSNSTIKSISDIKISGAGDLLVYGNNQNGITVTNGGLYLDEATIYVIAKLDAFDIADSFTINSGTILGLGNDNMQMLDDKSKQNSFLFNFDNSLKEGTIIALQNDKQENIIVFEALRNFKTLTLSTPDLKMGNYYLISDVDCKSKKNNGIYESKKVNGGNKIKIGISDTFWINGINNWYGSMDILNHYVDEILM